MKEWILLTDREGLRERDVCDCAKHHLQALKQIIGNRKLLDEGLQVLKGNKPFLKAVVRIWHIHVKTV